MDSPPFPDIILASASPRRHQLLREARIPFRIDAPRGKEDYPASLPAHEVPQWLASRKAEACQRSHPGAWIIAADTLVLVDGEILGKPQNRDQARTMLGQLSGRAHEVITGVHLQGPREHRAFSVSTAVHFREMAMAEIDYYLDVFSPLDKAGAYGIQEWIGLIGIERIEGDYYNVMGLPVCAVWVHLRDLGFPLPLTQGP